MPRWDHSPTKPPRATISPENPAGTDGFEFVEFVRPDPQALRDLFGQTGFTHVATHRAKAIEVWQQGDITYLTNGEPGTHASAFIDERVPACRR